MALENPREIKYNPEAIVGGKIDLSRFAKRPAAETGKRPEAYLEFLKRELGNQAREVNADFPGFLGGDGRIIIAGPDKAADEELITSQEETFRGREELAEWRRRSESNPASVTEMALTVMLHRFLKDDFVVARASKYDDYNNGVDQVLVDKKSGQVLCGFDEVFGYEGDDSDGKREVKKKEIKMKRLAEKGGAFVKYGAKLENGRLVRASVKNVPAFYLSLSKVELAELLPGLEKNSETVADSIFTKLVSSLASQAERSNLDPALKAKTNMVLDKLRPYVPQKLVA